jgi:hypothetical protein
VQPSTRGIISLTPPIIAIKGDNPAVIEVRAQGAAPPLHWSSGQ